MSVTESQIKDILQHPFDRNWTLQGFGMLRTYLDEEQVERLHIWDLDAANPDVSTIHDHAWDFTSRIVSGNMGNIRFIRGAYDGAELFKSAKIRAGEGGGMLSEPELVPICQLKTESYGPEEQYHQLAPELHESLPSAGTVTVIRRNFHANRDIATVCWRDGAWVTAEPRPATLQEIEHFIGLALRGQQDADA